MDYGVSMKNFTQWITLKAKLHHNNSKPPLVKERDIWWLSIGENIGHEINGKSVLFSRPALVFKKLSREMYLVIPSTSQKRVGTWYVETEFNSKKMYLCLH
jgi:mRNA interferase MazF